MRRTMIGFVLAGCLFAAAGRAQAQASAIMEFNGWLVAAAIGWQAVEGTLTYEGTTYPVTVMGTSFPAIGLSYTWGNGQIYGLQRIQDLTDHYDGAAFGATFVAGGHGGRYVGRNGVEVEMQMHSFGLDLLGGFERIRIVVHEKDGAPYVPWYWPGRSTVPR